MKWILVYIILSGTEPVAINALGPDHVFDDMLECFLARENLSLVVGGKDGYFPTGSQAVCVTFQEK